MPHARRAPRANAFSYPVSFFVLDLDELPELERRLRLFSVNRRNVVTFRDRDHFDDDGRPTKEKVLAFARAGGVDLPDGARVLVLAQLRVLGYVFNPVSFYWCYRADGELACMVAELSNTFGERLPELLRGQGRCATSTPSACTSRRSCRSTSATATRSRSRASA